MFVRKTATDVCIADFAEKSGVNGTLQVPPQLAKRCRTNLGWDRLCDKAKVATKEALYWQMKGTGAPKDAVALVLADNFPTSDAVNLGRAKKQNELQAIQRSARMKDETIAEQYTEIQKLRAQLTVVAARSERAEAQRDHLLETKAKIEGRLPTTVPFAFANELFAITPDAIERKGGLLKSMLSGDFASPFDADGVITLQWPNLLASDFSLIVSWYEDALPQFVSIERLERLLPYLDYLDLPACAVDLTDVARSYSVGASAVTEKLATLEVKLAQLEKKVDLSEDTCQRNARQLRESIASRRFHNNPN